MNAEQFTSRLESEIRNGNTRALRIVANMIDSVVPEAAAFARRFFTRGYQFVDFDQFESDDLYMVWCEVVAAQDGEIEAQRFVFYDLYEGAAHRENSEICTTMARMCRAWGN